MKTHNSPFYEQTATLVAVVINPSFVVVATQAAPVSVAVCIGWLQPSVPERDDEQTNEHRLRLHERGRVKT